MAIKNIHEYLGDGVYIEFDGYGYILRANNHQPDLCTDQIYIEPQVYDALIKFNKRILTLIQEDNK